MQQSRPGVARGPRDAELVPPEVAAQGAKPFARAATRRDKLRELAGDPERACERGRRGRQRVRERFDWSVLIGRTLALYEELLRA